MPILGRHALTFYICRVKHICIGSQSLSGPCLRLQDFNTHFLSRVEAGPGYADTW